MSTDFDREYRNLNPEQQKAVSIIDGPLLVIAGPGTGKTQIIGLRVANILKTTDIDPENILCLTFTEAAADNMKNRLSSLVGHSADRVNVNTFHGFGSDVINSNPEFFDDQPLVSPIDQLAEYQIIEDILKDLNSQNIFSRKIGDSFLHINTVLRNISYLKRAGLSPLDISQLSLKDKSFFSFINKHINQAFSDTISSKNITKYIALLKEIKSYLSSHESLVASTAADELDLSIKEIDPKKHTAKTITAWRNKWLTHVSLKSWQLKDQSRSLVSQELSLIYGSYQAKLAESGLYTFDDMILRTVKALEGNLELRLNLQEKFQYILIDEYQDTNAAQEKIVSLLADNPVNENRPNLMVVADDDQAIYRFQGAYDSILKNFVNRWNDVNVITLKQSYRSPQNVLDFSNKVITNAANRINEYLQNVNKHLSSKVSRPAVIQDIESQSETESHIKIAETIKKLIDDGAKPESIAVLAPKHSYLEKIAPFLIEQGIPLDYERREYILSKPRIAEIIDLANLTLAIQKNQPQIVNSLLPKVIASKYFNLSEVEWWDIAKKSESSSWLKILENSKKPHLKNFADSLKTIAISSLADPAEVSLAQLIGNKPVRLKDLDWFLPWRGFYFDESKIKQDATEFLNLLSEYNSLIEQFNKSKLSQKIYNLSDFIEFVSLYKRTGIPMVDTNPIAGSSEAVSLMTVYKAKGLEWDNVVLLDCHEQAWGKKARGRSGSFSLPSTLKWIEPSMTSSDDLIRLFYVGITRAKKRVLLETYTQTDGGRDRQKLDWISEVELVRTKPNKQTLAKAITTLDNVWFDRLTSKSNELVNILAPTLKRYRLSSTHLIDFLSVDKGGPNYFLLRHLLNVPDVLGPSVYYGNAVHKTLEFIHTSYAKENEIPSKIEIKNFFDQTIDRYPLSTEEKKFYKNRGHFELLNWLKLNKKSFLASDISEHSFSRENIVHGQARLTGKIDLIKPTKPDIQIVDYKTSSPILRWEGNNPQQSIKGHRYLQQLMFYKILVEGSHSLPGISKVTSGAINFIPPSSEGDLVSLTHEFIEDELSRFTKLINAVWDRVVSFNLPNVDKYKPTLSGIKQFEEDLINNDI